MFIRSRCFSVCALKGKSISTRDMYLYIGGNSVNYSVQLTLVPFIGAINIHLFDGNRNKCINVSEVHMLAYIVNPHLRTRHIISRVFEAGNVFPHLVQHLSEENTISLIRFIQLFLYSHSFMNHNSFSL